MPTPTCAFLPTEPTGSVRGKTSPPENTRKPVYKPTSRNTLRKTKDDSRGGGGVCVGCGCGVGWGGGRVGVGGGGVVGGGGGGADDGKRRSCLSMKRRCMHRIGVAEHLGVRLPGTPPRALDDEELFVIEG